MWASLDYIGRGWNPTPVLPGEKAARLRDWETTRIDEANVREVFRPGDGVGLVLGELSGGLVVLDLDQLDGVIRKHFRLPTSMVDGRPGKPDSHEFYEVEDRCPKTAWTSAKTGGVILELLGDGQQVAVPPSLHPSGETRAWSAFGSPRRASRETIVEVGNRRAVAQELQNIWPESGRHDLALPVAGGLLRAGWEEADVLWLLRFLCPASDRAAELPDIVERTARKLANDEPVSGWPTVASLTGERASVEKIVGWLNLTGEDLDDPRPRVQLDTNEPWVQAKRAWAALGEVNDPPFLFQSGGKLARVNLVKLRDKTVAGGEAKTQPLIETLKKDALRGIVSERLCWVAYTRPTKAQPAMPFKGEPPEKALLTMLTASSEQLPLPVLNRVVSAPIFGPDGVLQTEPGYHRSSHSYYWSDERLELRPIPAKPTQGDIGQAKELIFGELLRDFPFVTAENGQEASKAHALALGLLPFGRNLVDDVTPLHFIDAPTPGTGKDLLVQSLGSVWNGRRGVPEHSQTGDEEEWRKVLLSLMVSGADTFYIANVKGTVKSAVLEGALTGANRTGRVLSTNDMATGEALFTWIMTGNNASLGRDLARRVCPIRLDAKVEHPDRRGGWHHTLPAWAQENRAELLWAFLTLWQAWLAEGRPEGRYTMGSFERWAAVMGGVLDVAGVPGFLGNVHAFKDTAVDETGHWRELVTAWWEQHGGEVVKPRDLFLFAEQIEGFDFEKSRNLTGKQTMFGKQLKEQRDNRYGELFIRHEPDSRSGGSLYRLEHVGGEKRGRQTMTMITGLTGWTPGDQQRA